MIKRANSLKRVVDAVPCPFCGSEDIFTYDYNTPVGTRYAVMCCECMAGIDPGWAQNAHTVTEMWNKRAIFKTEKDMTDRDIMLFRFSHKNMKRHTGALAKELGMSREDFEAAVKRGMEEEARELCKQQEQKAKATQEDEGEYDAIFHHFMDGVNETAEETAALLAKL